MGITLENKWIKKQWQGKYFSFTISPSLRDKSRYQIKWIFGNVPKGVGSFSIQKFILQYNFSKMRGRGWSKAVWIFSDLVAWPVPYTRICSTFKRPKEKKNCHSILFQWSLLTARNVRRCICGWPTFWDVAPTQLFQSLTSKQWLAQSLGEEHSFNVTNFSSCSFALQKSS